MVGGFIYKGAAEMCEEFTDFRGLIGLLVGSLVTRY